MIITYWIIALFMAFSGVSGTVGATTLTAAQLAKHHHTTVQLPAYGTSKGFPQDAHPGEEKQGIGGTWYDGQKLVGTWDNGKSTSHNHSLSGVKSGSASSLPPYYALAYIMRIA